MLREEVPYEGAWFYSLTSSIYTLIFILGLFLTDAYLLAGHSSYAPVYAVLIAAELLKYAYIQLAYYKDISDLGTSERLRKAAYNPKQGFKLISIAFHLARQVRLAELLRGALVLAGVVCIVFVAAVLFGAEALARHRETLMFSCLVTVLTAFPLCLHQGVAGVLGLANGHHGGDTFSRVLLRNTQLTVAGAWLGAFVVPLDWDRPWQAWPVPCSLGALLGFAAAQLVSLGEIYSKHFRGRSKPGGKYR